MTTETNEVEYQQKRCKDVHYKSSAGDAVYGLGIIGAAIFYIGQATTFWMGVLGLLKAFIWPVFLVLEALKALM
jgi:hypothetical protein